MKNPFCLFFVVCLLPKRSSCEDGADNDTLANHKKCMEALQSVDSDNDNKINGDEFVEMVKLMSPQGFLEDATEFGDLYLGIKMAFTLNAVGLGNAAHIPKDGIENPTNDQIKYFIEVCLAAEKSINDILGPSMPPSMAPSFAPVTSEPTTPIPTWEPTYSPVTPAPTTGAPTKTPTSAPTAELTLQITYEVGYKDGYQQNQSAAYDNELETSMDILARQVINSESSGIRRLRRKLKTVVSENGIVTFVPVGELPSIDACPVEVIKILEFPECATLQHSLTLFTDDEDPTLVQNQFRDTLNETIAKRGLQEIIDIKYPNSSLFVITGYFYVTPRSMEPPTTEGATEAAGPTTLSAGASASITIGAIVAAVAAGAFIYTYRRGTQVKDEEIYLPGVPQELVTGNLEDIMPPNEEHLILNPNQQDYKKTGKPSQQATKTLAEEENSNAIMKNTGDAIESSSNAGSSGWSSSAGVSSLNTGSIDSMDIVDKDGFPVSRLATIGAQSAMVASRSSEDDPGDIPDVPNISREDLDSAIEHGDWAAVGATAALLAAASDSQSYSSRSRRTDTSMSRASSVSSLDAARAAELDHLVDAGDWEGVVVAAAKFEACEETSTGSSKSSRGTNTAGGSSGFGSPSESLSETPSKATKRDEIRSEVESLVRRVVPEEIDNVDEMMLQFKGREEELVETLRTMQERQVAQKARVQGRKQAKRVARQSTRDGGIVLPSPPPTKPDEESRVSSSVASSASSGPLAFPVPSRNAGISTIAGISAGTEGEADSSSYTPIFETSSSESGGESNSAQNALNVPPILGDDNSRAASLTGDSSFSSRKQTTALELAIEAGDWEAVGEAAAMMSDGTSTADMSEINRIAEQGESSTFSGDSPYKVHAERASELDDMIDSGNWSAVVAAASRFSTADSRAVSIPQDIARSVDDSAAVSVDSSGVQRGAIIMEGQEKERQIKEEQEALAQAEIWMAIAEQSKTDGSTELAGSDAADWAIARSISALKHAELEGELGSDDSQDRSV